MLNSLNAMDGITFMLQNLAAATVSIANMRNYLITINQCVIIIHIKYNIKIKEGRLFLILTKEPPDLGSSSLFP